MKQLDVQVIEQARAWLAGGQRVWLCTVLATYGSAPRGPGALLVALASGECVGSLSGGCVEEAFLQRLAAGGFAPVNQTVRYGQGGLEPTVALPCGGALQVLLEPIEADAAGAGYLGAIEQALGGGTPWLREVRLGSQARGGRPGSLSEPPVRLAAEAVQVRVGAARRLLIAGYSPVAAFCAQFAAALGYEVVLCDPRAETAAACAALPVRFEPVLPARFIAAGGCHAATAVVALTHDPRLDDLTLMEAVRTPAFYIGAMGSRRTSAQRRERLARVGRLGEAELGRVHAPIGLPLGSKTPAEIALAVMADIVRVANGVAVQPALACAS
ncbi:XdhC family protein [Pseudomonas sp. NPDC007930]|uniref:XdhC family protein n=1 Tax=Pseudomonas sp. NPDC007930 TaxID=3364417 RepID=UPI0036E435C9